MCGDDSVVLTIHIHIVVSVAKRLQDQLMDKSYS